MTTSTSTGIAAAPRRLGREERRASIVAAAGRAFAPRGFARTSMADIASAAGVSHLIVYRHFASKQELYVELLERATDRLTSQLARPGAIGDFGPTPAATLAGARADEPGFRILWHHLPHEPEFARWADAARNAVDAATLTALAPIVAPAHRVWAVRATSSYVIEAVLHWVEAGDPSFDERFVAATDAALRAGVRSWGRAPRPARATRGKAMGNGDATARGI